MARTYNIISADSHVNPPPTFWRDYLPERYRAMAPTVESTDEGDFILFEGRKTPFIMLSALAGKKAEDYKFSGKMEETRPGGWDPRERVKDLDLDGLDAEVLYGGGPLRTENRELAVASYRAYNEWLADFCKVAPDRFFGIAYIPMWEMDEALDEVRHAVKIGLRGCLIQAFPPDGGDYTDAKWEVLWNTLEELGLSAQMHVGISGTRVPRFDHHFLPDLLMSKFSMAEPIANFIFSGILEKHPKLNVVEVEGGVGWCAFANHYMDHIWEKHRYWTKNALKERPSFYFQRQVKGTFLDDPVAISERHTIGIQCIMWSSDYPHSETSWPDSRGNIDRHFKGVPADERFDIVCGNAVKLYNIA
ncbi:MAG: amidohydrolase [Chloroflexi bacterium]|nr:amidohydrolase [Chloroflexota bacterium]